MNEKIETGVIMNALAHMCLAFGSELGMEPFHLINYIDADEKKHCSSKMPFIILKSNSNKIKELRQTASENEIRFIDFINTMTGDTYVEQLERTKQTHEADLIYFGIVLFGNWDKVSALTKKFSLWK